LGPDEDGVGLGSDAQSPSVPLSAVEAQTDAGMLPLKSPPKTSVLTEVITALEQDR